MKDSLANTVITSLIREGGDIFAGTKGGGVILSTDNGVKWKAMNNGLPESIVYSLANCDNVIFAGTIAGVYISTNNGANWTASK